jgi:hypothetical protein
MPNRTAITGIASDLDRVPARRAPSVEFEAVFIAGFEMLRLTGLLEEGVSDGEYLYSRCP